MNDDNRLNPLRDAAPAVRPLSPSSKETMLSAILATPVPSSATAGLARRARQAAASLVAAVLAIVVVTMPADARPRPPLPEPPSATVGPVLDSLFLTRSDGSVYEVPLRP